jgi:hypothetical protein
MRPDDQGQEQDHKGSAKKPKHAHERWQDPRSASQPPRSWTNKTMHHPATRIGEIRHGKS